MGCASSRRAPAPHLVDLREVLLGERREQRALGRVREADDDRHVDRVGQRVVVDRALPRRRLGLRRRDQRPRPLAPSAARSRCCPAPARPRSPAASSRPRARRARAAAASAGRCRRRAPRAARSPSTPAGDRLERLRREHRPGQRVHQRELVVRARLGAAGERRAASRRRTASPARGPRRVGVGLERRRACSSSRCTTPMSVSACEPASTSATKSRAWQLAVAGHVPGRRPAQRARQRLGDVADAGRSASPGERSSRRILQ